MELTIELFDSKFPEFSNIDFAIKEQYLLDTNARYIVDNFSNENLDLLLYDCAMNLFDRLIGLRQLALLTSDVNMPDTRRSDRMMPENPYRIIYLSMKKRKVPTFVPSVANSVESFLMY